ncbi:hypothetical protein V1512DRAFT_39788 [Lipomyces arxii]|uniref:uncharacterized protein n=1 Tax=Lipomyces arxii TaxID=56418 RepID=UPI0034CDE3E4
MDLSFHVLPPHALLLRDGATLYFLSLTTLLPHRQPASFDNLAAVYPRPGDQNMFACVQNKPQVAISVWQYVVDGVPEDLRCAHRRTVIAESIERNDVPSSWDSEGGCVVFGLDEALLRLVDLIHEGEHYTFKTPDSTNVTAVAASPHAPDIFAISCASGRTFLCRLNRSASYMMNNNIQIIAPEVLHSLPDLAGRPVAAVSFHPTSTDAESLMLAMLYVPVTVADSQRDVVPRTDADIDEEVQIWCINVGKSVNLIRRLHPKIAAKTTNGPRLLKWSKNGRATQHMDNSLVVYDVRKNNGAQDVIQTPEGTTILAMDILRDKGVGWVLDSNMTLHAYDLLHCDELQSQNISMLFHSRNNSSFVPSIKSYQSETSDGASTLGMRRRKSSDILSYYLGVSPHRGADIGTTSGTDTFSRSVEVPNEDLSDDDEENLETQPIFPTTAIGTTSPLWTFTEPGADTLQQEQGLLPSQYAEDYANMPATAIPIERQEDAVPMPEPILPDCLFMNLGELMQGSDTGLEYIPSLSTNSRTLLELLFGWPPAYAGTTVRDLVAWERQRTQAQSPSSAAFVRMILNIWLRNAENTNPVHDLETALASVQASARTRAMTVSISWLVYAIHLVGLKQKQSISTGGEVDMSQEMARLFTNTVLCHDRETFGDDVEAVHLATGMLIACGMIKEAREIYRSNAYFM